MLAISQWHKCYYLNRINLNLTTKMSVVRSIDAIFVGNYDSASICYKNMDDVTDIVLGFLERSEYKDAGFKPKVKVLEGIPSQSWDVCHHIKVKNRVPYIIEISAFNPKSWHVTLYSKKPVKENGYSHNYLSDLFGELKDVIILNKQPYVVPEPIKNRNITNILHWIKK